LTTFKEHDATIFRKEKGGKMKSRLLKLLFALLVATILASVALTFAQSSLMAEEANLRGHGECERQMEHMHRECAETMNEMRHGEHKNFGNGHYECH
jgi:hypothetical protein